uniref:Uncharacterized protein n=1 Tax=Rhizophora mucronata TaxID=61149 RepID=A0A2P2QR21_RHIMU
MFTCKSFKRKKEKMKIILCMYYTWSDGVRRPSKNQKKQRKLMR